MKQKIMNIILISCISYTILSLTLTLISYLPNITIQSQYTVDLSLFVITTLVTVLTTITSQIKTESFLLENILYILDMFVLVYGVGGGIFKWFSWQWPSILLVAVICMIIYLFTYLIIYFNNKITAIKINKKLEEYHHEHSKD